MAAFADCFVADASVEKGLCLQSLECLPGTPVGFVEVGTLPQPLGAPPLGATTAGGATPPPAHPTPFCFSFAAFSATSIIFNSCFLNFGLCFIFILNSETH